jgi:hypothetical protein
MGMGINETGRDNRAVGVNHLARVIAQPATDCRDFAINYANVAGYSRGASAINQRTSADQGVKHMVILSMYRSAIPDRWD